MTDYLFVPQSVLDQWSEKGRVELKGEVLVLLKEKKSFRLTSAVRFLKMEAGEDVKGLLHKVKTLDALKQMGAEKPTKPEMYMPYQQVANQPWYAPRDLVIRASVPPKSLVTAVTSKVHELDPDQPVSNIRTMTEVLGEEFGQRQTGTTLLAVFAGVAMLLSAIGLYGVLSYFVTQRIPEFGVRIALGAQRRDILMLVLKRGMGLALVGLGIGLAASFALTRLMQSLLFEVSASDPTVFGLIAVLLLSVALAACVIPARRATKVDPMIALRYE